MFRFFRTRQFEADLLRLIATEMHFAHIMTASREVYGKSAFDLTPSEGAALGKMMLPEMSQIFGILQPSWLRGPGGRSPEFFRTEH